MNGRILVASQEAQSAGAFAARLETCGFGTMTAAGVPAIANALQSHTIDAVIVAPSDTDPKANQEMVRTLRRAARPRFTPIVCLLHQDDRDVSALHNVFNAVITPDVHDGQLAKRLEELVRMAVIEEETHLRAASLARRGDPVRLDAIHTPDGGPHALYVGEADPAFLAMQRAMDDTGGRLSAANTTFCAFDLLHDLDFDAVIVNGVDDLDRAMTLCSALRRNTKLYHTPSLVLVDSDQDAKAAFDEGASDVIFPTMDLAEMALHINDLALQRRRWMSLTAALRQARTLKSVDAPSGLATAHFFVDHMHAMAQHAHDSRRPLTIVVLRVDTPRHIARGCRDTALNQLGGMLRHLVRTEDFMGRLSGSAFAVALPNADLKEGEDIAERLCAVGECTAFESDDPDAPFQLEIASACAELGPGETGKALMSRTLKTFDVAKAG